MFWNPGNVLARCMLLIGFHTHEHAMLPLPFMSGCMNHPCVCMLWRGLCF